jgi:hypothetical protein
VRRVERQQARLRRVRRKLEALEMALTDYGDRPEARQEGQVYRAGERLAEALAALVDGPGLEAT